VAAKLSDEVLHNIKGVAYMQLSKGKISMRQALIFVFIAITSPLLRVLPSYSSISKEASWLVPIISLAFLSIYIIVLNTITKKYKDKNLSEIFEIIFGKVFGKIVTVIFLIWAIFLFSIYLRYFAERYLSTIMRDAYIEFLLITILLVAYYIVKNNIEYLARMFEIFFVVITILIVGTTLITFTEIRAENLLPVTTYDIVPVLKSSLYYVGLLSFMIWPFFFSDQISCKEKFKNNAFKYILFTAAMSVLIIISTLGSLGVAITQNFQIPFFILSKSISILDSIERIEAIYIAIWTITDVAIIVLFSKIIISILKNMFKLKTEKATLLPILLIEYTLSLFLARNSFELFDFSDIVGVVNVFICVAIPVVALVVGKIRKVV